jgi:ribosomal protein S18 acetylase RimI-like enzyme
MPDLVTLLDWDSAFFGVRIGRIHAARLSRADAAALTMWRVQNSIDCLYFLADADDPLSCDLAESCGFRLVDIRVTLDTTLTGTPASTSSTIQVRPATSDDLPMLETIARQSYHQTRFYADLHFARQRCDDLYALWIANAVSGDAAITLIAIDDDENAICGYLSCHLRDDAGQIGLVGVHPRAQGGGIGGALVSAALTWFGDAGARSVSVVTQGRNIAAQRLYQKYGFRTSAMGVWYHWWANTAP